MPEPYTRQRYRVLLTSDWHVGSMYAPCPRRFQTSYGSIHEPNMAQGYLNECWQDMVGHLPYLDAIITLGDTMDGIQPKDKGKYLWEIDPERQVRAALEMGQPLLDRLRIGGTVLCFEGTCYHDGVGGVWSEVFAKQMGGIEDENGVYAHAWEPHVSIGGIDLDLAHTTSYVQVNRTMPLEREIRYMLAYAMSREDAAYGVVRGHVHSNWIAVEDGLRKALSLPAWQLQSHYAQKAKTANRTRSLWIGSALLEIDPTAMERYDSPITFKRLTYPHPEREKIALVE